MSIVLIGAPGWGKMIRAHNLHARVDILPLFVAELLEHTSRRDSETDRIVQDLVSVGQTVPWDDRVSIVFRPGLEKHSHRLAGRPPGA